LEAPLNLLELRRALTEGSIIARIVGRSRKLGSEIDSVGLNRGFSFYRKKICGKGVYVEPRKKKAAKGAAKEKKCHSPILPGDLPLPRNTSVGEKVLWSKGGWGPEKGRKGERQELRLGGFEDRSSVIRRSFYKRKLSNALKGKQM